MMWNDPRLVWDPQEFGGMDSIRINAKNVWKNTINSVTITQSKTSILFVDLDPRYHHLQCHVRNEAYDERSR